MAILKKTTITATGDVGPKHDQLRKWVEANGGRWAPKVMKGVTHLICSKEHWKKEVEAVMKAIELGARIVSYDWLEDSLHSKRKLAEKKFLWTTLNKQRRQKKKMKRISNLADTKKFRKGCEKACEDIGSGTSASVSRKSSERASAGGDGFFRSSLTALAKAREKRAREEAEAKTKAKATANVGKESKPTTANAGNASTKAEGTEEVKAERSLEEQLEGEEQSAHASHNPKPSSSSSPAPPSSSSNSSPAIQTLLPPKTKTTSTAKPKSNAQPQLKPTTPSSIPSPAPAPQLKLTDNHHLYLDASGFEYNISLIRTNLFRNSSTRYNIRIFESHTKPHTYCTFIRYQPPSNHIQITASGIPILKTTTLHPKLVEAKQKMGQAEVGAEQKDEQFRKLLAPVGSSFDVAFKSLRHAFNDLTLLSWEERHHPNIRALQKARAKFYNLEPFIYSKPSQGLPVGVMPLLPMTRNGVGGKEEGYIRGALDLPGTNVALSKEGMFGGMVAREETERRRTAEEEAERQSENQTLDKKMKAGSAGLKVKIRGAKGMNTAGWQGLDAKISNYMAARRTVDPADGGLARSGPMAVGVRTANGYGNAYAKGRLSGGAMTNGYAAPSVSARNLGGDIMTQERMGRSLLSDYER